MIQVSFEIYTVYNCGFSSDCLILFCLTIARPNLFLEL